MVTCQAGGKRSSASRLIDVGFDEGNLDVADELIASDMVEHQDFGPDHAPGPEGVKAVIASLRRAFPDFHLAIDDVAFAMISYGCA